MRIPRRLPVYPWGDNEKLEFGDGADYSIYFDGTDFLIDSGAHSLEIDLATAGRASIYGGDTTGDDLFIYANSVDTKPYIYMNGNGSLGFISGGNIDFECLGASSINFNEVGPGNFLSFYEDGTDNVIEGKVVNNDIYLKPNGTGVVKFGTKTGTGDVAVDGYITIKDAAGNAVKLATVA